MESIFMQVFGYIIEIIVFLLLMVIFSFVLKKIQNRNYRLLNPSEYFPNEEIYTLKQIAILIMMALFFVNILYSLIFITSDFLYLAIFDIILSLYLASKLDLSLWKNRILLLLLIPYGSLTYIIFGNSLVGFVDMIHIPVFMYFIKVYYDKFKEYTESNGLGIAIILLFIIIFISFFNTQLFESVNALDSLVMVSNAFTSNGYAVLGHSIPGKINSILLVWGGYILSGVGTATLTAAILINHYNSKFEEYGDKLEKIEKSNEELLELIKDNNGE